MPRDFQPTAAKVSDVAKRQQARDAPVKMGAGTTAGNGVRISAASRKKGEWFVIARHWRGWTEAHNANAYEALLRASVLPGLKRIPGYRGGYLLRSDGSHEVEFVVMNLFESIEAVKQFAGPDYGVAVFEPEARQLLSRIEPTASHYEVLVDSVGPGPGEELETPSQAGVAQR